MPKSKRRLKATIRNSVTQVSTVYPKISPLAGTDWFLLEVPTNTPEKFVQDLAMLVPAPMRRKLDGFRIEISSYFRFSVVRLIIEYFGDFDTEVNLNSDMCVKCSGEGEIEISGSHIPCYVCSGSGKQQIKVETCPNCKGRGVVDRITRRTNTESPCFLCQGTGKRSEVGPQVILVEYVGACRQRTLNGYRGHYTGPKTESFASAWTNGGWNAIFPEDVLRAYFPPPPEKFDGDFYKALLNGSDLTKEYKKLARQFHPDLNSSRNAQSMFVKLREAYDSLSDPLRRKRYEAGLKFQKLTAAKENEIAFRIPKSCGLVTVESSWTTRANAFADDGVEEKLTVTKIIKWEDVFSTEGKTMISTWKSKTLTNEPPFEISWIWDQELVINL